MVRVGNVRGGWSSNDFGYGRGIVSVIMWRMMVWRVCWSVGGGRSMGNMSNRRSLNNSSHCWTMSDMSDSSHRVWNHRSVSNCIIRDSSVIFPDARIGSVYCFGVHRNRLLSISTTVHALSLRTDGSVSVGKGRTFAVRRRGRSTQVSGVGNGQENRNDD